MVPLAAAVDVVAVEVVVDVAAIVTSGPVEVASAAVVEVDLAVEVSAVALEPTLVEAAAPGGKSFYAL